MNEHMKKVHSFNEVICSTCDNVYKTASDLHRHINDSQAPIEKRKCSKCKKVVSSISNLKHHMMTQHIEERIHFEKNNFMVLHTEVNDDIVGIFLCTFCKSHFTNQSELDNHVLRCKKRNQCIFCEKTYTRRQHLMTHMKITHETPESGENLHCKLNKLERQYTNVTNRSERMFCMMKEYENSLYMK